MGEPIETSNEHRHPHDVLWLPTLPAEGSLSMNRYWSELDRRQRMQPAAGLSIRAALSEVPVATSRGGRAVRFCQKYILYPLKVRHLARGAALVHVLDHAYAGLLRQVPPTARKIVTVHDLAPLRMPENLTKAQISRFRRAVNHLTQADLLLADSKHTARDAIELLGCKEERIRVLALGADLAQFGKPQPAPLPDWEERFAGRQIIVSVGSVAERKNLAILPKFFAALRSAGQPVALVRVGDALSASLAAELRGVFGENGMVELGKISAEHLAGVYQRAVLLVFPSRLEGFGLPVIEAMSAGCPVVCSSASSLPEVGGDAALYFDPDDTAGAVAQATLLLRSEARRDERVKCGIEWAARFSWQTHYDRLQYFYREMLSSPTAVEIPGFA